MSVIHAFCALRKGLTGLGSGARRRTPRRHGPATTTRENQKRWPRASSPFGKPLTDFDL